VVRRRGPGTSALRPGARVGTDFEPDTGSEPSAAGPGPGPRPQGGALVIPWLGSGSLALGIRAGRKASRGGLGMVMVLTVAAGLAVIVGGSAGSSE